MEKLAFLLITAARKLRPYFHAHTIMVWMDKPLWKAMNNPEATRQLVLWAIVLDEFDVQYRPRTTIKAQALDDFIAEFTMKEDEESKPVTWMIWIDSSSNQWVGGVVVLQRLSEGDTIEYAVRLQFPTTNNEAEYGSFGP